MVTEDLILKLLMRANVVLASTIVLLAGSLMAYLFVHNFRNAVARTFTLLLACVSVAYLAELFLTARPDMSTPGAFFWLRLEWLGLAFAPAAYLHFSDALLRLTNSRSRRLSRAVGAAYALSVAWLGLALFSTLLVGEVLRAAAAVRLRAGPLFGAYTAYYFVISIWAARNVLLARRRALTSTTRRRMLYLLPTVFVPISVFPYLVAGASRLAGSPLLFQSLAAAANLGIAVMVCTTAYGVAYHGALAPDRVVKRSLIRYLVQGPLLGAVVVGLILFVPESAHEVIGISRAALLSLVVAGAIVTYQLLIVALRPVVDLAIYRRDTAELRWLRRLDDRMLTASDVGQLLENVLTATCDRLGVQAGVVVTLKHGQPHIEAFCGPRQAAVECLERIDLVAARDARTMPLEADAELVWPLCSAAGVLLGVMSVGAPPEPPSQQELDAVSDLVAGAVAAVRDWQLQEGLMRVLRQMEPEVESLQRLRGRAPFAGADSVATDDPIMAADFPHWVRDALRHYWGGPNLTESPLLGLELARQALARNDYNPAQAVRDMLSDALEHLKPEGQRSMMRADWLMYNILELKFVRGLRVRDIARRLAMSESDLYRKQRLAVEALAQQLTVMEELERQRESARRSQDGMLDNGRNEARRATS